MKAIFVVALFFGALATWTKPKSLLTSTSLIHGHDLYTDVATGIHHFLADTGSYRTRATYMQVSPNDTMITKWDFNDPAAYYFTSGRIFGRGVDRNLYIQLSGVRQVYPTVKDQWFGESIDGGVSWSPLIRVPREKMNDNCERFGNAAVATAKGRLFIFYLRECKNDTIKLCYVTRPPDSIIFTSESVICEVNVYIRYSDPLTAEVTTQDGKTLLHVLWLSGDYGSGEVMYIQSVDNGLSWTAPKVISTSSDVCYATGMLTLTVNNDITPNTLVGTYSIRGRGKLRMFYSNSDGKEFDVINATLGDQEDYKYEYRLNAMCICGPKPTLYVLTQVAYDIIEYAVWDLRTMKVERPEHPFEDIDGAFGVSLSCIVNNSKTIVTAIMPGNINDNVNNIYIAHDER